MMRRHAALPTFPDTRPQMLPVMPTSRARVTSPRALRVAIGATVLALVAVVPSRAQAQAQRTTVATGDTPSRDAASRRIGDSLTVHRLRHPKAKTTAPASARNKKGGTIDPAHDRTVVETPLPTKARQRSSAP